MPKSYTFPTLYDDLNTVSISFLNEHGYLKTNQWQRGIINWSRNGNRTGSISIIVDTNPENAFIELDYKFNETPIKYRVRLITAPSNIGKGVVWYFVCPRTGKRCRKLYLSRGYFYHREAFSGMYDCQTQSKQYRQLKSTLGAYFTIDQLYEQVYKKHFKKQYAGKPTKKYLWLLTQIQRLERTRLNDIKQLLY